MASVKGCRPRFLLDSMEMLLEDLFLHALGPSIGGAHPPPKMKQLNPTGTNPKRPHKKKAEDDNRKLSNKAVLASKKNSVAIFRKWQRVQYWSTSHECWVNAVVVAVRSDGAVQIDVKDSFWISLEEQTGKLRIPQREAYEVNTRLDKCNDRGEWEECRVLDVHEDEQSIKIDIEPETWYSMEAQTSIFRPHCPGEAEVLMWKAEMLVREKVGIWGPKTSLSPEILGSMADLYATALHRSPHNVRCMDFLAEVRCEQGRIEDAETLYEQALDEDPFDLKVLSDFQELLKGKGEKVKAKNLAKREVTIKDRLRDLKSKGL